MNKLSKADEKCVMEALQECAAATKSIEDKEELHKVATAILSKHIPKNKPELYRRACEGYNSAKSLYKLSSLGDGARSESFTLLDGARMFQDITESASSDYVRKTASANGLYNPAQFYTDTTTTVTMPKAASAYDKQKEEIEALMPMRKLSSGELRSYAVKNIADMESALLKVASRLRNAERTFVDSKEQLISALAVEPKHQRKEAADMLGHAYGAFGKAVIELFNETRPLQKVATAPTRTYKGTVKLPDTELTRLMAKFASANRELQQAQSTYKATIANVIAGAKELYAIHKEAAVLPAVVGGSDISRGLIGTEIIEQTPEMLELKPKTSEKIREDINSAELINHLKAHGVKRAFMDIITDDTVARYPINKVQTAFNDSLSELPLNTRELPSSAYTALLKSRVLARLGRNNAASAADTEQIQNTQNVYGKLRTIRGELQTPTIQGS